jgi:hypothetical protein
MLRWSIDELQSKSSRCGVVRYHTAPTPKARATTTSKNPQPKAKAPITTTFIVKTSQIDNCSVEDCRWRTK